MSKAHEDTFKAIEYSLMELNIASVKTGKRSTMHMVKVAEYAVMALQAIMQEPDDKERALEMLQRVMREIVITDGFIRAE